MGPGSRDEFDSQGSAAALEEGLMTGRGLRSRAPVAAREASPSPTRDGQGVGGVPAPVGGQPWDDSAYRWSAPARPARRVLDEGGCATWSYPCPRLRRAVQPRREHGGPQGKIVLMSAVRFRGEPGGPGAGNQPRLRGRADGDTTSGIARQHTAAETVPVMATRRYRVVVSAPRRGRG